MEMDPNPPSFNIPMSVQPLDLGADYAKGMAAGQSAGEQFGKGITAAFDVANRNRTADDTLKAMAQTGILSKDAYDAVAGKALGAKEAMLGMYAGNWIAQQAQNRELNKMGYQGNVDIQVAHAKLQDQLIANRVGGTPNQGAANRGTPNQAVTTMAAPVVTQPTSLAGVPQQPTPLGSPDITNPLAARGLTPQWQMTKVGPPLGPKEPIPTGAIPRKIQGPQGDIIDGFLGLDGTFRPIPKGSRPRPGS